MLTRQAIEYIAAFTGIFLLSLLAGNMIGLSASLIPLFAVLVGLLLEPPKKVEGKIQAPQKSVWVGEAVEVTCETTVTDGIGVVALTQQLPAHLELIEGNNVKLVWKGLGKKSFVFRYTIRCSKRGKYELTPIQWESRHFAGLTQPSNGEVADSSVAFTVKPKLLNIRRVRGIIGLASSPMPVIDIAKIGVATTDFREIREYVQGDSVKTINWKATAKRAGRGVNWPLVNEYEVEGKKMVWIFLDGSSAMEVGTAVRNPLEHAVEAASGVAYYYIDRGFRVGMYIYHHGGELLYPDTGRRQFNKISRTLVDLTSAKDGDDLPMAIDKCRRYILGYNPLCVVITRLDDDRVGKVVEGAKKLAMFKGRTRRKLPLMVISIPGYHVVPLRGEYDSNSADIRHLETRPVIRRLRATGSSVLEWNPRREDFGRALLRQVKTR